MSPKPGTAECECLCLALDEADAWLGTGEEAIELALPRVVAAPPLTDEEAAVVLEICDKALACRRAFRAC